MIKYGLTLSLIVSSNISVAIPLNGLMRQGLHSVMAKNNATPAGLVRLYSSKQNDADSNANNGSTPAWKAKFDAISAEQAELYRKLGGMTYVMEDCRDKCNILIDNGTCNCIFDDADKKKAIVLRISALNLKMQKCMDGYSPADAFDWVSHLILRIYGLETQLKTTNNVGKKAHIASAIKQLTRSKAHWEKLYAILREDDNKGSEK